MYIKFIIKQKMNQNNFTIQDPTFPYNPPSIKCQPIIDYAGIHYHKGDDETTPLELFAEPEWKFGIFKLNIRSEIPITSKHIHIFYTIDGSGSMSDECIDGKTKMQHIHYTLENMIRIFYENQECNISIHVQSFDTRIEKHITNVSNIKDEKLEYLLEKIKKIIPGSSTNIEVALNSASEEIREYKLSNPEHEVVHLFLTDGEITDGSTELELLKNIVPDDCINIFIGYGLHHDSGLLSFLANKNKNEYRFIDVLEKAGLVYGEIIHGILYKAIADVTINTNGCEIYDFQKNDWKDELIIGDLLREQKKTYHIRSRTPELGYISVVGRTINKTRQFEILNDKIEVQIIVNPVICLLYSNLIKYMFRQRTQELLYESRLLSDSICVKRNNLYKTKQIVDSQDLMNISQDNIEDFVIETNVIETKLKSKLTTFRNLMLKYMKEKKMETDPIMKMLCDDIYICIRTIGTDKANMFICARQSSQGREQSYACSALEEIDSLDPLINLSSSRCVSQNQYTGGPRPPPIPILHRQINSIFETNQPDDIGLLSQETLTPYSSKSVLKVMRDVSGDVSILNETLHK